MLLKPIFFKQKVVPNGHLSTAAAGMLDKHKNTADKAATVIDVKKTFVTGLIPLHL